MANRRPQGGGRRVDFGRNDRGNNYRGVSPWQGGGPGGDLPNLLPLGGPAEATLALASNLINLLQPRQNPVPSLLDMPIRRDFGPAMNRYDRGYGPNRMGNQGSFRRTGNYNRAGERINNNRKPFRPNDGQRQQNKGSPKKDADSKAKPGKESDETGDKADKNEDKKDTPKTRYDDINQSLLRCHICNKSMWDGRSFENHLNGRAHSIMMQKTAESYALTADTMRQEFKIREMKRTRKTGQQPLRDFYCAMCDMYAADGAIHRTTVGHRKLKKYLHPACTSCHKEMPTRIELDEHRLSAEHLRQLQDKQDTNITKPKLEVMVFSTLSMEQMYLRDDRQRSRRYDRRDKDGEADKEADREADVDKDKTAEGEQSYAEGEEVNKDSMEDGEAKKEDGETKTEVKKAEPIDKEDTVLDYKDGDDVTNVTQEMLPAYSTERGVGRSFLKPLNCIQCQLCHKLLDSEETAEVHLRTWRHHQLFIYLLNEKSGQLAENQQAETGKRSHSNYNDDSGTWKRRKTAPKDEDDEEQDEPEPEPEPVKRNGLGDTQDASKNAEAELDALENQGGELAADDLEDWEQSVDELLDDVNKEPEAKPEPEPEPVKKGEEVKKTPQPKSSPRGRGRGRGRRPY
ncbi:zinc finger protein on ecdysone puffs isoform X2 [Pararge aegeria]|uniref:zinc finger protein on ecdysone puffs isoform X2 n=1 Tax=Pararge aegeria TaxID=116150 RepID=UPI0019CFBEFD|nr:zinc finger protein on ecdysone puffs isoform X2 [Pararge aegeria]